MGELGFGVDRKIRGRVIVFFLVGLVCGRGEGYYIYLRF